MATNLKSQHSDTSIPNGAQFKIGIVVSSWNNQITDNLLEGCQTCLQTHGVSESNIEIARVPGAYELPMGARILAASGTWNAIICLGCVIKGETKHDEYISNAVSNGLMQLGLTINTPVIFGLLTPNDQSQAEARAGGQLGNKGIEAAETALHMAALKANSENSQSKIGFS